MKSGDIQTYIYYEIVLGVQTTKEKEKNTVHTKRKKHTHNLSSRNTLNETSHNRCCKKVKLLNVTISVYVEFVFFGFGQQIKWTR